MSHPLQHPTQITRFMCIILVVLILGTLNMCPIFAKPAETPFAWPPITAQTRPWAFWWWMGSAVDKTNLTQELERYQQAGLGGVQIIPIYGAIGWEDKYIQYLSSKWMTMMGWSVSEAHRLGMGVDMTLGTGWCFGGPTVSDKDANARVIVNTYNPAGGEPLSETFNRNSTQALIAFSPDGKIIDLTGKIAANGSVDWKAPSNSWKVYAITQEPSGQKVKRAAPGGEGWMLNPIYPQAVRDWLPWFDAAFKNYHGPKPRAVFQDSYEYNSDWAPDFFAQFEKFRGYKLQDELPALFGKNADDHYARVKFDYRQTVSDIMTRESQPVWISWAHQHGFLTRDQAHGSPGNLLDLYADADIPETETAHDDLIYKFASSAAHVAGHQLTSSETGTWLGEHFTVTLADLKFLADKMFLSGVNHIVYHGLCYSPDQAGWPGWHFYASTEMNPRNSIWHDVPALNEYIARCQSVLQSGRPDNDVLLYWPIADYWMKPGKQLLPTFSIGGSGWFEGQPVGATSMELWHRGYAFDYVSDAQLQKAKFMNGKIQMPGGNYKVIVVPPCQYIPFETFEQLLNLAKKGATVVFENHLPADVPGANNLAERRAAFQRLRGTIKFDDLGDGVIGKGQVFCSDLKSGLAGAKVSRETMTDAGLFFIRRSFVGGWNYFIANRGTNDFDGWITPACPAKSFVILDPMNGNSGFAATRQNAANATEIHLQLQPGESVVLRALEDSLQQRQKLKNWNYWQTAGQPVELTGPWNVKFVQGGPTLPAPFQTTLPESWTTDTDTNAQAFAGSASYTITFDAPNQTHKSGLLNLGDVRQSARVELNGKDYGDLITPPFRVVVDNLKPTGNVLEVEVTSVAANRIRDLDRRGVKWKTFHDINFVSIHYKSFDAANWPLTPCGLLGPVTLTETTDKK